MEIINIFYLKKTICNSNFNMKLYFTNTQQKSNTKIRRGGGKSYLVIILRLIKKQGRVGEVVILQFKTTQSTAIADGAKWRCQLLF